MTQIWEVTTVHYASELIKAYVPGGQRRRSLLGMLNSDIGQYAARLYIEKLMREKEPRQFVILKSIVPFSV